MNNLEDIYAAPIGYYLSPAYNTFFKNRLKGKKIKINKQKQIVCASVHTNK